MFAKGDGIATKHFLTSDNQSGFQTFFQCERYNAQVGNRAIQDNLLKMIVAELNKIQKILIC